MEDFAGSYKYFYNSNLQSSQKEENKNNIVYCKALHYLDNEKEEKSFSEKSYYNDISNMQTYSNEQNKLNSNSLTAFKYDDNESAYTDNTFLDKYSLLENLTTKNISIPFSTDLNTLLDQDYTNKQSIFKSIFSENPYNDNSVIKIEKVTQEIPKSSLISPSENFNMGLLNNEEKAFANITNSRNINNSTTLCFHKNKTEDFPDSTYSVSNDQFKATLQKNQKIIQQGNLLLNERRKRRRESHNAVERRRRDNINEKIQELSTIIPNKFMSNIIKMSSSSTRLKSLRSSFKANDLNFTLDDSQSLKKETNCKNNFLNTSVRNEIISNLNEEKYNFNDIDASLRISNKLFFQGTKDGRPNKGIILHTSVEYIKYLHLHIDELEKKNKELQSKIEILLESKYN